MDETNRFIHIFCDVVFDFLMKQWQDGGEMCRYIFSFVGRN